MEFGAGGALCSNYRNVSLTVFTSKGLNSSGFVEEDERREIGQLEAVVEDENGLHPAVGDEGIAAELREALAHEHAAIITQRGRRA